jgi:hypothetical protein
MSEKIKIAEQSGSGLVNPKKEIPPDEGLENKRREILDALRGVYNLPIVRKRKRYASIISEIPSRNSLPENFLADEPLSYTDATELADVLVSYEKKMDAISETDLEPAIVALLENEVTDVPIVSYKKKMDAISEADLETAIISPQERKDDPLEISNGPRIVAFVREGNTPGERQRRIDVIEDIVARAISSGSKSFSFPLLAVMGEIEQYSDTSFVPEEFAQQLEASEKILPMELENKIDALFRANNPQGNLLAHKIIDFFGADITALQNVMPDKEHLDEYGNSYNRFVLRFIETIASNASNIHENYLIRQHLQDIYETVHSYGTKEGAVDGIAGGALNETIYTYHHLQQSYNLRTRYGIHKGYLIPQLVLPIAPGYLGQYNAGRLETVFDVSGSVAKEGGDEGKYIAQNDPSLDAIYDRLNEPVFSAGRSHPSQGLTTMEDLWSFDKRLKDKKQKFFFDVSRIDAAALHPFVLGEILHRNEEYLKSVEGGQNQITELSKEEYLQRLFPAGGASEDVVYSYQYLMRLNMRKAIEEDLRIDMADLPLYAQAQFLNYINDRSVTEIDQMKAGLDKVADDATIPFEWEKGDPPLDLYPEKIYISDFVTAFLACSEGGEKYGDAIISLANALDRDASRRLFAKYAEIADTVETVKEYLRENFQQGEGMGENLTNQIAHNLLERGNEIIKRFADAVAAGYDTAPLFEKLDEMKAGALLFTSTIKALRQESGPHPIDLRELQTAEFNVSSGADLKAQPDVVGGMRRTYRENYRDRDEYTQEFSDALINSFDDSLDNPNTRFYLLKHKGDVAAFCRFDHKYKGGKLESIYFGSFNTNPSYWRGKVGETMLDQALLEERALGVPIYADCNPMAPVSKKYIESGFVATGQYDYKGVPSFKIALFPDVNERFISKDMSTREIMDAIAQGRDLGEDIITTEYAIGSHPDYSPLREGYVLTRYFDEADRTICVFERADVENNVAEAMPMAA